MDSPPESPESQSSEPALLRRGLALLRELIAMHPGPFAVAVTGSMLYAGATVGSTIVLGRITDDVIYPTFETGAVPDGALAWGLAGVFAATFLRVTGVMMRRYFAGMTSERCQRSIRRRLIGKYLALPLAWHHRTPTGQLLAHADNDTDISTEVLHPLPFSLGVAFLAIFSAISLLVIDPWLALVAFLIFPALTVLNRVYSRRVEQPSALVQAGVGRVSSIAHESFDGALVVKTLGRARAEGARFGTAANELRRRRVVVGYIRAVFESIMDALPSLGIVLVVVFGAYRIDAGAITRGDLVQVAALFSVLALPMRVLGFFLEMLPPSVVARRRLDLVLEEPDPAPVSDPLALPAGPLSVQVRDLAFAYRGVPGGIATPVGAGMAAGNGAGPALGGPAIPEQPEPGEPVPVLSGIDFDIAPGEVVALVGSTGAGKSTLCQLVSGLVPPNGGTIEVGGRPVERLTEGERTGAVALVFQESFLFADTITANIDLAGHADRAEIERAATIAQAHRFITDLPAGYDTVVGERGVTLSGGQRQRVALARALVRRPRLLLLDDATSAVDPKVEQEILAGLRSGEAPTSLIVAQRVSTIMLADRVLYLAGGRIAAAGPHRELMAHPGYAALVRAYELGNR